MNTRIWWISAWLCMLSALPCAVAQDKPEHDFHALEYNNPGLQVDLGVGLWAWPLPMDFDGDGDFDLVVSCPDKPYNGTYFFENTEGNVAMPVFQPGVRIGPGFRNIRVSHVGGGPRVLVPGREFERFTEERFDEPIDLRVSKEVHQTDGRIRANQWTYADYDQDGALDLIVGVGDWHDYGWDDAYNARGEWTRGPLRGFVYVIRNAGTSDEPEYEKPFRVQVGDQPLEVFGWPSPNFADFDDDGDLDLVCGEFLDRLTYFENTGSANVPAYAAGRFLSHSGETIRMDLQMIVPVAVDWDRDGDLDLVVGDEDGRVALVENTGRMADSMPEFLPPQYFRQHAAGVKFGALVTPFGFDWDGDGDDDLICGNTAGYIGFIENLDGGDPPQWAAVRRLTAGGEVIRIQAGPNGSIQGPCEAKWGYTTLSVADWDHDELPDLIINSIWGELLWYRNVGTRRAPQLAAAQPVNVEWSGTPPKPAWNWWNPKGRQLVTQWRTTPVVVDFDQDGLNDLVMLDHEGYLAFFQRRRGESGLQLLPGQRVFINEDGTPLRLNAGRAGKSGRRKLHCTDWDGDGRPDFLLNGQNADLLRNVETHDNQVVLKNMGPLSQRKLAGHTSSPTTVDWNRDGVPEVLVGAEDGRLYFMRNPRTP